MSYHLPLPWAQVKAQAKARLAGSWGSVILATLFYGLCSIILYSLSGGVQTEQMALEQWSSQQMAQLSSPWLYAQPTMATGMTAGSILGMSLMSIIAGILVSGILGYAYIAWFVDAATNQPQKMTFSGFTAQFAHWARGIKSYIWQAIWVTLWGMLLWPILIVLLTVSGVGTMMTSGDTGGFLFILAGLLFLAVAILVAYKILHYQVYIPLLADAPSIGVRLGLRQSIAVLHGHIWELFVLYLSFIPWYLLCLVTLGLGALYLIPYQTMTLVYAYIYWRNQAFDEGRVDAALFGYRNKTSQDAANSQSDWGAPAEASENPQEAPAADAAMPTDADIPPEKPPTVQPKDFALKADADQPQAAPEETPDAADAEPAADPAAEKDSSQPSAPSEAEKSDPWTGGNA